jgi:uncharacterized protein DUF3606
MVSEIRSDPKDPVRIDLEDPQELGRWARALECAPDEVRRAVAAVGPLADRVRHYLARQKPPANDPSA